MNSDLKEKLQTLAFNVTDNFCYSCYKVTEGDNCPGCGTDDFMRHLDGVGVEYGTDGIIEHLINSFASDISCTILRVRFLRFNYL